MNKTINLFTSLVAVYAMVVCFTCKQYAPYKVGTLSSTYSKNHSKVLIEDHKVDIAQLEIWVKK